MRLRSRLFLASAFGFLLLACGGSESATDDAVAPAPTVVTIAPGESTTTTAAPSTTQAPSTETTIPPLRMVEVPPVGVCAEAGDTPCIELSSLGVEGDAFVAEWEAIGFSPSNAGNHAHFYWNTFRSSQVGSNASSFGVSQGSWELTDQQPWRSSSLALSAAPTGATGLCVTAANSGHGVVEPGFYDCTPLQQLAGDLSLGFLEIEGAFIPVESVCIDNSVPGRQLAVAQVPEAGWTIAVGWDGDQAHLLADTQGLGAGWPASTWTSSGDQGATLLEGFGRVGPETRTPIQFAVERAGAAPCV